jgi:hypothetical protein
MSNPNNIKREHVLSALEKIDVKGYDRRYEGRKWFLKYEGKTYPCKYPISLANLFANGVMLSTNANVLTSQSAIKLLRSLGFNEIVRIP